MSATEAEHSPRIMIADFGASWMSFAFAMLFAHPVDTLRVRWQTRGLHPLTTIRADGVRSLYGGLMTPMVLTAPLVASMFAVNEFYRTKVRALLADVRPTRTQGHEPWSAPELMLAGTCTGVSLSVVSCPLSLIRIHQQLSGTGGNRTDSFSTVVRRVYSTYGLSGFYRALPYEAGASAIGCTVYYSAYELAKGAITARAPVDADRMLVSFAAAITTSFATWIISLPTDLLRNRLQADALRDVKQYASARDCVRQTYRADGIRGFWRGLPLTLARSFFSTGITLPVFDIMKPRARRLVTD